MRIVSKRPSALRFLLLSGSGSEEWHSAEVGRSLKLWFSVPQRRTVTRINAYSGCPDPDPRNAVQRLASMQSYACEYEQSVLRLGQPVTDCSTMPGAICKNLSNS